MLGCGSFLWAVGRERLDIIWKGKEGWVNRLGLSYLPWYCEHRGRTKVSTDGDHRNILRRSLVSGQWSVVSGQWSVVIGQW